MADRDEYDDRDERGDDDRPRRRREYDDRPPKKKGNTLLIVMVVVGGILVLCGGGCAVGGYFYVQSVASIIKTPDEFLAKLKAQDFQGAYDSTAPSFRARYTLQQFTAAMKGAKLDQNSGAPPATSKQTGNNTIDLTCSVSVPGKSTSVTFTMKQQGNGLTFLIDDITGPDISYTGAAKSPVNTFPTAK
jgi:hypothetical protein